VDAGASKNWRSCSEIKPDPKAIAADVWRFYPAISRR